jgi:hypothetical protein
MAPRNQGQNTRTRRPPANQGGANNAGGGNQPPTPPTPPRRDPVEMIHDLMDAADGADRNAVAHLAVAGQNYVAAQQARGTVMNHVQAGQQAAATVQLGSPLFAPAPVLPAQPQAQVTQQMPAVQAPNQTQTEVSFWARLWDNPWTILAGLALGLIAAVIVGQNWDRWMQSADGDGNWATSDAASFVAGILALVFVFGIVAAIGNRREMHVDARTTNVNLQPQQPAQPAAPAPQPVTVVQQTP